LEAGVALRTNLAGHCLAVWAPAVAGMELIYRDGWALGHPDFFFTPTAASEFSTNQTRQAVSTSGEFTRVSYSEKTFRYYAYDLLEWTLAKRTA
jgi:hypothetical protein